MAQPGDDRLAALLAGLTPDDAELIDPPAGLWEGIASRIAADGQPVVVDDAPPVVAPVVPLSAPRRGSPNRVALLAAAAVVVLAGVVAGVVWAVRDEAPSTPTDRLLASAELRQLEPLGTTRATAKLVDEGGRKHLVIDATDMAAAPDGSDYELWLIDPGVTDPRSLGIVTGSGDIVVPDSIDTDAFPIVDISLEPRNGDHQHSGHSLMRGTLQ